MSNPWQWRYHAEQANLTRESLTRLLQDSFTADERLFFCYDYARPVYSTPQAQQIDHLLDYARKQKLNLPALVKPYAPQAYQAYVQAEQGWNKAAQAYGKALYDQVATIRILGKPDRVKLQGIYSDVYILNKPTATRYYQFDALLKNPPKRTQRYLHKIERVNGLTLIQQPERDRLFVLGKPGAGKTTFMRYLTLQALHQKINKIPFFITLKDWSIVDIPLLDHLTEQLIPYNLPQPRPFLEYLLTNGLALLLLDGLDEVNKENDLRQRIEQQIEQFCLEYLACQVVVTCRIAATERAFRQFQDVEVADFTSEQIRKFVGKWFYDQPQKREAFLNEFFQKENEPIQELGNIPILLTLLCLVFDETMTFPHRRAELYEYALNALLNKWDAERGIRRDRIYKGLSLDLKKRMFAQIAYQSFQKGKQFFTERELVQAIEQYLVRLPRLDRTAELDGYAVLRAIIAHHSIFVIRAQGIYAFSHLTFQEYFTAKYIADNERRGTVERLMPHLTDQRWREIFLLTATLLDEADEFFELSKRAVDRLVIQNQPFEGSKTENFFNLLGWINQKVNQTRSNPLSYPRLTDSQFGYLGVYLALALALARDDALALDHASALALARDDVLDLNLDLDPDLARALNLDLDFDLARALTLALTLALDHDLALALDYALTLALVLNIEQKLGLDFAIDLALTHSWQIALIFRYGADYNALRQQLPTYRHYLDHVVGMSHQLSNTTLMDGLTQLTQRLPQTNKAWQTFADELQQLMQTERNLFPDIQLNSHEYKQLNQYLEATKLLQDCLAVAVVSDRTGIEGQMLRVPQVDEG